MRVLNEYFKVQQWNIEAICDTGDLRHEICIRICQMFVTPWPTKLQIHFANAYICTRSIFVNYSTTVLLDQDF